MVFNSGWSRAEIESLTYRELFDYVEIYYKQKAAETFEWFKAFCIYNAESSAVAFNSKQGVMNKYLNDIKKRSLIFKEEAGIDEQFEGLDFGK